MAASYTSLLLLRTATPYCPAAPTWPRSWLIYAQSVQAQLQIHALAMSARCLIKQVQKAEVFTAGQAAVQHGRLHPWMLVHKRYVVCLC
jgi:hypothetical protein